MAKYSNSLSVKEAKKAVYDSIRTYGKKPFCIDEHLKRLKNSASLLGFELPETLESIQKKILHDINTAPFEPIFLKVIATPDNVWIEIRPLLIDPSIYKGVRVMTVNCTRDLVKCKKMYAPEVEAAYEKAVSQGYYEALLMDEHGYITEGTRSNILWVSSNTLFFCDHALSGITQAAVLKIAKEKGVSIREAKLHFDELSACDELFLTQTSRGIVPIGNPGPITTMLMQSFDLLHA